MPGLLLLATAVGGVHTLFISNEYSYGCWNVEALHEIDRCPSSCATRALHADRIRAVPACLRAMRPKSYLRVTWALTQSLSTMCWNDEEAFATFELPAHVFDGEAWTAASLAFGSAGLNADCLAGDWVMAAGVRPLGEDYCSQWDGRNVTAKKVDLDHSGSIRINLEDLLWKWPEEFASPREAELFLLRSTAPNCHFNPDAEGAANIRWTTEAMLQGQKPGHELHPRDDPGFIRWRRWNVD